MRGREGARYRLAGVLGQGLVGALFSTVRLRRTNPEAYLRFRRRGEPVIFVFWHDQLLPLVWVHRNEGIVVLVSEHADGEYISRIIGRHGFGTARGSSTRGGARALRSLVTAAREGRDLALTPDGPRGPRHRFKPGALVAARLTGLPLVPIAVAAAPAWRLRSWDRFLVPRPFSTVAVRWGEPHRVPSSADREELREHARTMERSLNELSMRVAESVGREPGDPGRPRAESADPGEREGAPAS